MHIKGVYLGGGESYHRTVGLQDNTVFLIAKPSEDKGYTVFFQTDDESKWRYSEQVSGLIKDRNTCNGGHAAHSVLQCEGDFFELSTFSKYAEATKLCRDIYYNRQMGFEVKEAKS